MYLNTHYQVMRHTEDHDGMISFSYKIHKVAMIGDELQWTEPCEPYGDSTDELLMNIADMARDAMKYGIRDSETGAVIV